MQPTLFSPRISWLAVVTSGLLLAGCGSDDSNSSDTPNTGDVNDTSGVQVARVNAASHSDWVYLNLDSGQQVSEQDDWHLALQRSNIKLNGGVSGTGKVTGAVLDAQDEFYQDGEANSSVFSNASADSEAQALLTEFDLTSVQWSSDSYRTAMQDWYVYNPTTHQISAPQQSGWLVRHADGETYSKVRITELSYSNIALSYETQAAGTQQFAADSNVLNANLEQGSTELCLDFDSASAVDCTAADWEWRLEIDMASRAVNLWSNGGVHGTGNVAVLGPIAAAELDAYTSASNSNGQDISRLYVTDSSDSVFSQNSWYAYNLTGQHKLWPNFRTYAINTNSDDANAAVYAVQISNYYSLGDSGSPELRFRQINQGE